MINLNTPIKNSIEDLERIDEQESVKIDTSILSRAQDFHISLEGLEAVGGTEKDLSVLPTSPQPANINKVQSPLMPETFPEKEEETIEKEEELEAVEPHLNLERVELPLREIIRKIFWRTSRPIVIISDDKIIYVNQSFLDLVGKETEYDVLEKNFFEFVSPEYWDKVSNGIGDVLTKNQGIQIGIKGKSGKVIRLDFEGIYITDEHTFSFILLGILAEKKSYAVGLFNEQTGLPNYELLRDRIKMSIASRSQASSSLDKNISALLCIQLETSDFMDDFKSRSVLKRIFERLLSSLNKYYTLAHGEENKEFWIFIPEIESTEKLVSEVQHIKDLFETPVEENYSITRFKSTIGVSTYPEPATSAKKLVEEAKLAKDKAIQNDDGQIVYFGI